MIKNYKVNPDESITFNNGDDLIRLAPIYDGRLSLTSGYPSGFTVTVRNKQQYRLLFAFHLFWDDEWLDEGSTSYWIRRSEELGNVSIAEKLTTVVIEMIDKINEPR